MAENATNEEKNGTVTETVQGTPLVESEEVTGLEAEKARLEEEIRGLSGTVDSLKDDIVRRRQERKGDGDQQPVIDREALLADLQPALEAKLQEQIKPVLKENEELRKTILKSNEEILKAKKVALDSINARMASVSGSKGQASSDSIVEDEVVLSDDEKKVAGDLKLKNPRYLKDVEVYGL